MINEPFLQAEGLVIKYPLVYILTLSWNQCADTLECLASLQKTSYPNYRLLVVDNHSTDGSVEAITQCFPRVEVIANRQNIGFAAAANRGIEHALCHGAEYVFLLNNDTIVEPTTLEEMVSQAMALDVGMVAPKIYYYADPQRIWSVGSHRHPLTLEKMRGGEDELDQGQWEDVVQLDFLTGCGLLLPRHFLEDVGLFDERFFIFYEDSDLCLRARKRGYRLLMTPKAKMWHKVSVSSGGRDSPFERYWMARSSVLFFRKHIRGAQWLAVVPWRLGSALRTSFRLGRRGHFHALLAYWRGLLDGWLGTQEETA